MVASPWKFLVGLTRRHGKDNNSASIEDTSETPIVNETQESARFQPPAALALPTDGAQDPADQVDADSSASDDVPDIERVVEVPAGPDEPATTTGLDLQTEPYEVSATTKPRKARVFRKKNASAESPSTPSTAPAVSNDFQDLDDEIWQLRRQLAMKLQLQNAQLRKMLERFAR
ncbi:hypothetical protein [Rhizobium sp. No.120]